MFRFNLLASTRNETEKENRRKKTNFSIIMT